MSYKEGVVCHAQGDRCHGCLHYQGKADVCEYARPQPADAEDLVKRMHELMNDMCVADLYGKGATEFEGKCYRIIDEAIAALSAKPNVAHQIADRLPIWMLDTYDRDSLSSMLSAVSYLKQVVNDKDAKQDGVVVSRECAEYARGEIARSRDLVLEMQKDPDSIRRWNGVDPQKALNKAQNAIDEFDQALSGDGEG